MTKVIVKDGVNNDEVYNGQIRESERGRIVMVITDKRFVADEIIPETRRVLVLREGKNGFADPFTTVPTMKTKKEDIIRDYPKVLSGTITIEEA